jgi:PAS domain S-box-containing protein
MTLVASEPSAVRGAPSADVTPTPQPAAPTPAQQALAQVRRSSAEIDALLARVFELAAVGVALMGLAEGEDDVVLEANASFAAIFGRSIGALRGTCALSASIDPAHAPALTRATEQLLLGAVDVHRGQYRFLRADGERRWLDVTASIIRDPDGRSRYRLVHVLDVTAERTAYAQGTAADACAPA